MLKVIISLILLVSAPFSHAEDRTLWLENEPITPIPNVVGLDDNKVRLGERLFHDANLSGNGTVSCATCHGLENAGIDSLPISVGINGQLGTHNAPTVLNSSLLFRQFWDGRVLTLEEQISSPLTNPKEMGGDWQLVVAYLRENNSYNNAFIQTYSEQATKENVSNAIAEFERSLLTPNSDFDLYLKGDSLAISKQAKRGYYLFKSFGCISCHQGVAVGGNLFEKLGVVEDYYNKETANEATLGHYNQTGIEEHIFEFKVPSLRNVALTAPYFHDGHIAQLDDAVKIMARYQLGRHLSDSETANIIAFLDSLNGVVNEK